MKKMRAFRAYLKKKPNKIWVFLMFSLLISYLASSAYFIYSITLFEGIETFLRNSLIAVSSITNIIFILLAINVLLKDKYIKFLLFLLVIASFGLGQFYVAGNLNKFYSSISAINKEKATYSSSLIVLEKSDIDDIKDFKDLKIGIIDDVESVEGYQIPQEMIDDHKLESDNEIVEYEDFVYMLGDLYDGEVDAIFLSSNYADMFMSIEGFEDISTETVEITSKQKELAKEQVEPTVQKEVTEPFTMLIMGVDSKYDGIENATSFNGDSLMLLTFNPITLNTTILSIPRDTYVPITCFRNDLENKITHAAWQGESCMIDTIENFTGITIDYYVKINFKGVVDLVDTLGGITVDVPIKFCESDSNRSSAKHICLEKGVQVLDGEEALALSRHRKTINDFIRGQNQQLVVKGMIQELKEIKNIDTMQNLLDVVSKNMDTNLSTTQILSFYNIAKDIMTKDVNDSEELITMDRLYLSGYSRMIWDEGMGRTLYNFVYFRGSLNDIVDAMKINLGLKDPVIVKKFSFSINEPYEELIIGQKTYSEARLQTVPRFTSYSKTYATTWGIDNGVTMIFETIDSDSSEYIQDQIIEQSIPYGYKMTLLDKTTGITLKIVNKIVAEPEVLDCELEENYENSSCLVPDLIGYTITELNSWISNLPVTIIVNKTEVATDDPAYDSLKAGLVTLQSETSGIKLIDIESLDVTYMAEEEVVEEDPEEGGEEEDPPADESEADPSEEDPPVEES